MDAAENAAERGHLRGRGCCTLGAAEDARSRGRGQVQRTLDWTGCRELDRALYMYTPQEAAEVAAEFAGHCTSRHAGLCPDRRSRTPPGTLHVQEVGTRIWTGCRMQDKYKSGCCTLEEI